MNIKVSPVSNSCMQHVDRLARLSIELGVRQMTGNSIRKQHHWSVPWKTQTCLAVMQGLKAMYWWTSFANPSYCNTSANNAECSICFSLLSP